jgi:hypothetical protein
VIQVISDGEVQTELNLSSEQQQQVGAVLRRVKAMEDELFAEFRSYQEQRVGSELARQEQRLKKYDEAHQQLAIATEKILEQLTPAQRTQLQAFCQQAKADEAGFQARMLAPQTGIRFSGGGSSGGGGGGVSGPGTSSRGEYLSGGGPGGVVRVISYERVQQLLGLNEKQRGQIAETIGQVNQFETGLSNEIRSSYRRLNPEWYEQRKQKEDATRQAVSDAGEEILRLLPPVQRNRLKEICLQAQGVDALFKPEIIQALGLTATEQIKLANLRREAERQTSALYGGRGNPGQPPPPIDFNTAAERTRAIQRETERRMITSVLTPAQQIKLKEMQGKEFAGAARFGSSYSGGGGGGGTASSSEQSRRP